jgi:hypothetical protein
LLLKDERKHFKKVCKKQIDIIEISMSNPTPKGVLILLPWRSQSQIERTAGK